MDNQDVKTVPYIVFESEAARHERHIKRLIGALIFAIMLLFVSNVIWLHAWMQYDYTTETEEYSVDLDAGEGNANYIGQDGDIVNGSYQGNKETDNP